MVTHNPELAEQYATGSCGFGTEKSARIPILM